MKYRIKQHLLESKVESKTPSPELIAELDNIHNEMQAEKVLKKWKKSNPSNFKKAHDVIHVDIIEIEGHYNDK